MTSRARDRPRSPPSTLPRFSPGQARRPQAAARHLRDRPARRRASRSPSSSSSRSEAACCSTCAPARCCGRRTPTPDRGDREPDQDDDRAPGRRRGQAQRPRADHPRRAPLHRLGRRAPPQGQARVAHHAALRPAAALGQRRRHRARRSRGRDPDALHRADEPEGTTAWACAAPTSRRVSGIVDQGNYSCARTWR